MDRNKPEILMLKIRQKKGNLICKIIFVASELVIGRSEVRLLLGELGISFSEYACVITE